MSWSCGASAVSAEQVRKVAINAGAEHKDYLGNQTRTTKYTLLTFLPKALYEQVSRRRAGGGGTRMAHRLGARTGRPIRSCGTPRDRAVPPRGQHLLHAGGRPLADRVLARQVRGSGGGPPRPLGHEQRRAIARSSNVHSARAAASVVALANPGAARRPDGARQRRCRAQMQQALIRAQLAGHGRRGFPWCSCWACP